MPIFQKALETRAEPKRPLVAKIIGGPNARGFATAIGNKLKELPEGDVLDATEIAKIRARYKITKPAQAKAQMLRLLSRICDKLVPQDFTKGAGDRIRAVAGTLQLPSDTVNAILADAGVRAFKEAIVAALADDNLTEREHDDLKALAKVVGMEEEASTAALLDAVSERLGSEIKEALSDGELSPEEDAAIAGLAKRLRTDLSFTADTEAALEEARHLWRINRGPLAPVESPLLLRKGEIAYAVHDAEAVETRKRTTSYRYSGPSFRVRIMKGVSYRVGSASVSRSTEEYSHSFGKGVVVLTNKRALFRAAEKTININFPKVIDYELFRDGVKIYKETGKPLTFILGKDDRTFALLFARLLSEAVGS